MKHAIASVCLSGDLRQKIEAAAAAGFSGIEIFENDLLLFDQSPKEVKRIADDNGIAIVALQPFRDFECMPAPEMARNFDRAQRKFDIMDALGTSTLFICSNVSSQAIDNRVLASEHLHTLASLAAERQIKLGYEALAWGRYVSRYEEAWEIVRHADHPQLGIVLDSFHLFSRGSNLSLLSEIPGHKITMVQIADAPWLDMDVLQWSRHFRCFPGQGDFPLVEFMQKVMLTGYSGYVSHEIFNDEFRASPGDTTARDGKRSLLWLEDEVIKNTPDILAPAWLAKHPFPPSPSVKDIEFIEFATAGESRSDLLALIRALGFTQTHQHRNKDVALFRNGDVSFVLNQEPDSFAQNHYLVHGTSVCAIAYQVDNARDMLKRAAYFNYPGFAPNPDSGEMQIPGIRGMNGELVYFVQSLAGQRRFFDVDFIPLEIAAPSAPYTMRVDHVTSGIAESEFLSTSLFYRALFGLNIAQPQDLIDPHGLVVSRTATSANKKIRLPFNMSRSGNASTERFRQNHAGSGVQHIALHCSDILNYVTTIDQAIVLPIPQNYYDDLEARYDLPPALSAQLRRYNLLYDRSQTGDFIHFYTKPVNGLFFEVVQRNQYGNYGEANAAVRMAAQARLK